MKRVLSIALILLLCFSLFACESDSDTATTTEASINTTTTTVDEPTTTVVNGEEATTAVGSEETTTTVSVEETTTIAGGDTTTTTKNDVTTTTKPVTQTTTEKSNHTHSFANATCSEPKKCVCGETEGNALGHKYSGYTCKNCNGFNPNQKYIDIIELGVDGEGYYGRAGEDHGFVIKDECKNYVANIDNITATINGKKCTVHLALNKAEIKKLSSDYIIAMKEYYEAKGWEYDEHEANDINRLAQEFLICSAIVGIDFPSNTFEGEYFYEFPCDFIITVQYTLADGTKTQQNWKYDAIYAHYSRGTIPAKCFSHTK